MFKYQTRPSVLALLIVPFKHLKNPINVTNTFSKPAGAFGHGHKELVRDWIFRAASVQAAWAQRQASAPLLRFIAGAHPALCITQKHVPKQTVLYFSIFSISFSVCFCFTSDCMKIFSLHKKDDHPPALQDNPSLKNSCDFKASLALQVKWNWTDAHLPFPLVFHFCLDKFLPISSKGTQNVFQEPCPALRTTELDTALLEQYRNGVGIYPRAVWAIKLSPQTMTRKASPRTHTHN